VNWLARHRRLAFAAICLFWTAVVFAGYFFPALPFISMPWRGEQSFEDLLRKEGWKTPTHEARSWKDLPAKTRSYLKAISELTGAKLFIASVGPGRDQTIFV